MIEEAKEKEPDGDMKQKSAVNDNNDTEILVFDNLEQVEEKVVLAQRL
ncbi:MAG: hypothetical protein R6U91_06685 [Bacillota bacterium]